MGNLKSSWKKRYLNVQIPKKEDFYVLSGFNTDIDLIINLEQEKIEEYLKTLDLRKVRRILKNPHSHVKTEEEFFAALSKSIGESESGEVDIDDKGTRDRIIDFFGVDKASVGGQGGIVSNFLSEFTNSVLYTPFVSENQRKYFREGIKYPVKTKKGFKLEDVKQFSNTSTTKKNVVFEYREGLKIPKLDIVAKSDSRFILSDYLEGYRPIFPKGFLNGFPIEDTKRVFLSGYQDIQDIDFEELTDNGQRQIQRMKEVNKNLKVHLELISQRDIEASKAVLEKIGGEVHSIGCDEPELCQILKLMGKTELKNRLEKDESNLELIKEALIEVMEALGNQRFHLHTKEFLITVTTDSYGVGLKKIRDSLLFGGYAAVVKASTSNIPSVEDLIKKPACHVLDKSVKEIKKFAKPKDPEIAETGIYQAGKYNFVFIPSLIADKAKRLVGLGDIISSGSFVAEVF